MCTVKNNDTQCETCGTRLDRKEERVCCCNAAIKDAKFGSCEEATEFRNIVTQSECHSCEDDRLREEGKKPKRLNK